MKRIAIGLMCSLIGVLLMTSCSKDEDEVVKSSEVALLSFSIRDLRTGSNTVISGGSVPFTIDQTDRTVYNKDSIMFGANITRVLVNVTADGDVCYLNAAGELCSIGDSIDFTNPVTFRVISSDGRFARDYTVRINVHQVNIKETSWLRQGSTGFPNLAEQKAFVKDNRLCVIGVDDDGAYHTASATLDNYTVWASTACSGIAGDGISVLLIDDNFYLKTDAGLYSSEDATTWASVDDAVKIDALPGGGIGHGIAWFCQPLKTNEHIMRTIFIASPEANGTYAQVWTKLSTEEEWVAIVPQGDKLYGCPNLKNLTVIQYAGNMYAFGGERVGDGKVKLATFESRDNGLTWKQNDAAFKLPQEYRDEADCSFSAATDGKFVWMMWNNGEVWRGRWNGLVN